MRIPHSTQHRLVANYQLYQEVGICIGSGSVESWIKQIGARIKIIGAQWNRKNVPQMLYQFKIEIQ